MAAPARDIRNKAQQLWPGAGVFARGRNWIKHQNPTNPNKFMLDVSVGPMHIEGTDTEIDTAWQTSAGAWQWEMTLADFQAHSRDTFNAGNLLEFRMGNEWVIFDPQSINWVNEVNSRQQIAIKQAVTGIVEDDVLRFPEGYGPGRHFQYQNQTARLQKLITIDSPANLPAPTISGTIWFEAEFSISASTGVDFYLDGVKWTKANNVRVKSANRVEFRDAATGTQTLWWLDFPRAFDSAGNEIFGEIEVRRQGGPSALFITIRIPKTWIDAAVFPIFIDPTIDVNVAASGDDGYAQSGNSTINTNGVTFIAGFHTVGAIQYRDPWLRYTGLSGLSGVTIDVSYITLDAIDLATIAKLIRCEESAAPAAPTSYANFTGKTRTTASVAFTGNTILPPEATPSLNAIVQEIVDTYDPSAIQFLFEDNGQSTASTNQESYASFDAGYFSPLHIEYTAGGVVVTITDTGMGADQTSLEASMSLPEGGSGGDNLSLLASLALSEFGSGADSPELAASLGIPDSGSGDDEFIDLLASLSPQEFGQGTDSIAQLLATLVTSDIGIGVDDPVLAALLGIGDQGSGDDEFIDLSANLSTLDSGFGTDTVSQILASLSVSEGGSGSESTTIQVTLSITDQGTGTDAINVLKAILKIVTDTAFGLDGTSISVVLSSGDTAFGTDSPTIQAQLVISDTSSASDIVNVLKAIIKTVSDIGTGTEGIQITASIPVSESGIGTDQIAQILASLLVSDVGTGVDIVIVTVTAPSGAQIIKISFIIKKSTIDFAVAKPAINFELEQPSISFDLLSGG